MYYQSTLVDVDGLISSRLEGVRTTYERFIQINDNTSIYVEVWFAWRRGKSDSRFKPRLYMGKPHLHEAVGSVGRNVRKRIFAKKTAKNYHYFSVHQ